jgi:hypothetical protein
MSVQERISELARQTFHEALPQGWRIVSIQSLPIPGREGDHEVARITNGDETRYLALENGRVQRLSRAEVDDRLKEYRILLDLGTAWLRGVGVAA